VQEPGVGELLDTGIDERGAEEGAQREQRLRRGERSHVARIGELSSGNGKRTVKIRQSPVDPCRLLTCAWG
jgi:hypothetical protein